MAIKKKTKNTQKGKGIIDRLGNMVLSDKHNRLFTRWNLLPRPILRTMNEFKSSNK